MELQNYKGHQVYVNDRTGDFYLQEDGSTTTTAPTLEGLKKRIDKMKKGLGLPVFVLVSSYYEKTELYKLGKITSRIWKSGNYSANDDMHPMFHVQFPDKKWREESPRTLIKVTDNNQEVINQVIAKKAQVKQLDKEIAALQETLETYTPQELGVEQKKEGD